MTKLDIAEILAAIAAKPAASWPELVATQFPGDPALAAQALIWLRAHRECLADLDDEVVPRLEGDRYELGVLLDVGATASVWQAHDRKLGRNVAIKIFRDEQSPVIDEILAEARAAAEVTSDHVVRVLDVHDADPPYIVMELVGEWEPRRGVLAPGASAATLRPRSLDEAVRWVRDIARGVHDAHLRNVFHRDLKPHNVLITPFSRRARIADFGLAITEARDRALQIAGTPGYMAPEQAAGLPPDLDPHDLDDRAVLVALDVWGLGAVAFDLLAERPPWQAELGLEPWERAASAREAPELPRGVPRRLRRIVTRALALDPKARYATAGELADDLDAYLARTPTSHDTSRAARVVLWCRRNPQLTLAAGLATLLATLSLVAYINVVELRTQRNALAGEAEALAARAKETRAELASTETELAAKAKALDTLRATVAEADKEYKAIVQAKERELRTADAATKQLADALAAARSERDEAQLGRELYEGFWNRARAEADEAAHDRDQAQRDRDAAHKERDQATKERDSATAARTAVEKERDRAIVDRDRAEAERRRIEADLARLAAELAAMRPKTGSATPPPDAAAAM
jgi:protein kinase-like protein